MSAFPNSSRAALPVRNVEAPTYVFDSGVDACNHVAQQIAGLIRERNSLGRPATLGLVAGSSPVGVYQELARLHEENDLDFSRVAIFMVNEYYGLSPDQLQSQRRWIIENFVKKINIAPENVHFFDSTVPLEEVENTCRRYEAEISGAGGIDVLLLGVAENGAVGFNEPYTSRKSRSRLAALDPQTRRAAAAMFFSEANVPTRGFTMGFATMMEAKKIVVLAFGDSKAAVVKRAIEEPLSDATPVGWLRNHADVSFIVDKSAAAELQDVATPWATRRIEWTDANIKRAVLWLCGKSRKSLLKLTDADFRDYGLHSLLRAAGEASEIAERVFGWMMETVNPHPAGTAKKRSLAFSPHPDDDVISMGGTMIRLVEDGHELHMAYMTSGNIAVNDHDAYRFADLMTEMNRLFGIDSESTPILEEKVIASLRQKRPGEVDSAEVLQIKRLIRWSEARAACKVCGVPEERAHFLNLPFYATGAVEKLPPSDEDRRLTRELIEQINPEQIYVAGDLSDPHGTHRVCAQVIFAALREMKEDG
ncbi:MAG: PIG-L family deacetylase, partial [Thermoguttaceae bacterium]|nr:PIG-L family deacetylase [Thermoguttaceae bacterium]